MAAAYAALISLLQTIDQIERHPRPPIYLDKEQVESLTEKVSFLQQFLEDYPPITRNEERERLESRIAGAAYMAEDIVESHIVDQIQDGNYGQNIISVEFYRGLQRAIEDLDVIKLEVMEIKSKMGGAQHQLQLQRNPSSMVTSSSSSVSMNVTKNSTMSMVGFDGVLLEILNKLDDGQLDRQIIPIVGMGGIGKTTLARNVYAHPYIEQHFDICAWVTISLKYDARKILDELLCEANLDSGDSSEKDENEIGEVLHKYLFGRRYLIILDDMWSIDAWDCVQFFFPNCNNGSRIVVTTRRSDLARQLPNSCGILDMKFLDNDKSWDLFSKIVFPEKGEGCPHELEEIGKKIVRSCGGLPLSVVVVGGILVKSGFDREYWQHIKKNMSSIVNSENDEQCLKILQMSYDELPVHLKPCFLHFGFFKDVIISVFYIVKLWVAEGFIKPAAVGERNLEEVGEEYMKELVDRNLISVYKLRYMKKRIKAIEIHDQVRDLCLRRAEKERFYNMVRRCSVGIPQDTHSQRRLFICDDIIEDNVQHAFLSMSLARSFLSGNEELLPSPHHRLLRIFQAPDAKLDFFDCRFLENQLVNLRLAFVRSIPRNPASTLHLLWNLQILIIEDNYDGSFTLQDELWNMHNLRHVLVSPCVYLSNPPSCRDQLVLENLQILTDVTNFKCGQEVVKRIPNVNLLGVNVLTVDDDFDLSNLDQLHKLESFICTSFEWVNLSFPHSLKKLILHFDYCCDYYWEDILEKIGSLPLLQKLILQKGSFRTRVWETVEGQFPSLKVLKLRDCYDLKYWTSESSHFPRLEHLVLDLLGGLDEIPSGIGEIETMQSMVLKFCSESVVVSAKRMQEEQEELYGEVGLLVRVLVFDDEYEAVKDLASSNFEILVGLPSGRLTKFYQHLKKMREDLLKERRDVESNDEDWSDGDLSEYVSGE